MKPSFASNYGLPAGAGAVEGAIVANAPLGTNAYILPPAYNPARAGYEAGAREFAADDPRRAEWIANAEREDVENPVRKQASKDFENPWKLVKRTGFGAAEGGVGGIVGAKIPAIGGRMYDGAKSGVSQLVDLLTGKAPRSATMQGLGGGTPPGAGGASPRPTAGAASSGEILPPSAVDQSGQLARTLAEGQQPGLSSLANSDDLLRALQKPRQPLPEPPRPPSLPSGMRYRSDGVVINAHTGHPIKKELLMGREAPARKRDSKSAEPDKEDVQIDDMRPLRYPEE